MIEMASYKIEYKTSRGEMVRTLMFKGRKYSEIWQDSRCHNTIINQLRYDYPRLMEDIEEILDTITGWSDDDEIMEALNELREYE